MPPGDAQRRYCSTPSARISKAATMRMVMSRSGYRGLDGKGVAARIGRVVTKFAFDAQQLIVLGDTIGAAQRSGLDLCRPRGHGDVSNRAVFRFARSMRND